jgi:hypothetical protein
MSTKDKTGDRLVASIRRTRAGAQAGTAGGTATAKESAPRRAAGSKAATSTKKTVSRASGVATTGSYQSAGRVWPD